MEPPATTIDIDVAGDIVPVVMADEDAKPGFYVKLTVRIGYGGGSTAGSTTHRVFSEYPPLPEMRAREAAVDMAEWYANVIKRSMEMAQREMTNVTQTT